MKKRKIVFFLPLFALLLGGCDISSVYAEAKKLGHKVLDPVIDLVKPDKEDKKDDQGGGGGGQQQTATAVSISEVLGVPETIEQGATLSVTGLKAKVLYSDGKTKEESVTKVELNTSAVGQATGKAFVGSLFKEFNITVVAKDVPPVVETITPQQAIALMDQAGDGVVVAGLQKVKGICAVGSQYDSKYKQYTTGFDGVSNFKLQFTDSKNILNGGSPDGMEIVVEGYLEKYQGKYQLSYLPGSASPTGEKFTPDLVSAQAVMHEGALDSITVSSAHREFYKGSTFVEETVTAHYSDGSSATVKGTFTGYDMNTVGEQTVTVSYTEKEVTKTVTYKINVIERTGGHAGTLEDPLTTAEAATIANGLAETTDSKNPIASEGMYVKGVVTEFKETFSADFGNYSMVIGGDFTLWRIKNGPEFAKFNAGDIEVGDEVTAFVYIMNFKGTPESTSNSYVHSVQKAGDTKTLQSIEIVGSLTKTSYVEGQTYSSAGLSVKGHYDDGSEGVVAATITLNKTTAALGDTEIIASATFKEITAEPKTFTVTVTEKVPVVGGSVYTFKNDKTSAQNMGAWTSEQFMKCVEVDGGEIITGMKNPTNAFIGGNGGSGDATWNIWDSLKIGKSGAKGEITLLLDGTASFSKIKVSAIGARDDGTLTINEITQNVTKKAIKGDLEPIELEYEITGGITELKLSSKDAASNNYSICITKIEFVDGFVPTPVPKLDSLELTELPSKVDYYVGDEFDPTGMEITAKYTNDGKDKILEAADYSIDKTVLSLEDTFVTVSYTEDGVTKTVDVPVTVTKAPVPVTGISLNKTEVSMKVNEEDITLAATVAPEDADDPTVVWSVSKEGVVTVNNGVVHAVAAGEVTVTATAGDFHADCVVTVAPADKVLSGIEVTTPPSKTSYVAGEIFDPTGMVVTASYSSGHDSEEVTGYTYSTAALEETDTTVEIDYNGQKAYVAISVSPAPVLDSITVANAQGKTAEYAVGDVISKDDIVVTAHYTQGKQDAVVTDYTISKTTALAVGDTSATITYVEGGVEKTCVYSFTVAQANLIETMTAESLGLKGSYESFSVVSSETGVLFEGNAMLSNGGYIQMRDTAQGSGIYSRTSGRYLKSIAFEFDSANGKTISVYGLNGAYKDISSTTEGTLLGSVTSDGKITAEDNYLNFCIVSTGATYIKSITVEWSGTPVAKSVESVTLNKTAADVGLDSTLQLSAIVDGVGASQNIVWETSDATKATVENGLVTPVAGGEVTITAKSADDNSVKAECVVTVTSEKTLMATDFATTVSRPSHSNYADTWSFGDFSITNGANNSAKWDYIKLGKKSTSQTCTVDAPAAPAEVKKVIVAIHDGSLAKTGMEVTEWGVEVFSDSKMTTSIDKVVSSTAITKNAAEVTFTPSAGKTWAKGCFIRVYFNTKDTGGNNGIVCLTGITYIG